MPELRKIMDGNSGLVESIGNSAAQVEITLIDNAGGKALAFKEAVTRKNGPARIRTENQGIMSLERECEKSRENTTNPTDSLPVCTQFARPAGATADLARLLAELAILPEDTRLALAALLGASTRDTQQLNTNH